MSLDTVTTRGLLNEFNLRKLFIEELGWDRHTVELSVTVDGLNYTLAPIAEKRGVQIFECSTDKLPPYILRQKIDRQLRKLAHEHLIIFTDNAKTTQIWQWVSRHPGKPVKPIEYEFHKDHSADDTYRPTQWVGVHAQR